MVDIDLDELQGRDCWKHLVKQLIDRDLIRKKNLIDLHDSDEIPELGQLENYIYTLWPCMKIESFL